jgi:drug/metabolite transporter (DMT)-like permease
MSAILLGLAAALLYGGSDFLGGLASRTTGSLAVTIVGSTASVALVLPLAALGGGPAPTAQAALWGLGAGVGGGIGTLSLYRGLARGQMSVVGPVSAVGAAIVPVVAGVALGERPGGLATAGVLVALPAIALVAMSNSTTGASRTALFDGLVAGAGFGLMFVALARAGDAGLWPVAFEQSSCLVLVVAVAIVTRTPLRLTARRIAMPVFAGVTGAVATALYFFATQRGLLSTVAVLTSLYPGITVVLARVVVHERFRVGQRVGLGLCALAVVAIAVG